MVNNTKTSPPEERKEALVVVAHPDDEILWCGGTILMHPHWSWHVLSLCRASDPDRSPRFRAVLKALGAEGDIADLDDGPDQDPLPGEIVEECIQGMLPARTIDVVITHGPRGEYTRHRRHEEVCRGVVNLWRRGALKTDRLWMFAFEDGGRAYTPRAIPEAPKQVQLNEATWTRKLAILTDLYGFALQSWETRTTPHVEAFWMYDNTVAAFDWVQQQQKGLMG